MTERRLLLGLLFVTWSHVLTGAEFAPEKLASLKTVVERSMAQQVISGAVVVVGTKAGVARMETVGYAKTEGAVPMKPDTVFRIASMTKPMTAILIMQLVEQQKIQLSDPVEKYLPEFQNQWLIDEKSNSRLALKRAARKITVHDLLTHTSGMPGAYPEGLNVYGTRKLTLAESIYLQSQRPLEFEPGTKWAYCNAGIDTLGRIVEVVSGKSFEQALSDSLLKPLGMVDTTTAPRQDQLTRLAEMYQSKEGVLTATPPWIGYNSDLKHPMPAGGLLSTGADLARLSQCLLNGGELNGIRILKQETLSEMTRPQTGDLKTGFVPGMCWGLGFSVVKEPGGVTAATAAGTYGHGGAFGTQYWMDPVNDVFVILLIQRVGLANSDGSDLRREIQSAVYESRIRQ